MEKDPKKKYFGIWSAEDYIKEFTKDPPTPQDIINQAEALKTHKTFDKLKEIKRKVRNHLYSCINCVYFHEEISLCKKKNKYIQNNSICKTFEPFENKA